MIDVQGAKVLAGAGRLEGSRGKVCFVALIVGFPHSHKDNQKVRYRLVAVKFLSISASHLSLKSSNGLHSFSLLQ